MQDQSITFSELYRRYDTVVRRFARKFHVASHEIDDVAQEVWITTHDKLAGLDLSRELRPWLGKVTFNHVMRRRRTAARAGQKERALADASLDPHEEAAQRRVDDRDYIQRLLEPLSELQRNIVLLCLGERLSAHEAAELLEVTPSVVRNNLHTARGKCEALAKSLGVTGWMLLLADFCASGAPEPFAIESVTALLATQPPPALSAVQSTGSAATKLPNWLIAGCAAAAALIGLIAWDTSDSTEPHAPLARKETPLERVEQRLEHRVQHDPPLPVDAVTLVTTLPPPEQERPEPLADSRRWKRRRTGVKAASVSPAPAAPLRLPSIKGHLTLLQGAEQALDAGRPEEALRLLNEDRQEYPENSDTRDLLRIHAHCALGREDHARAIARSYPDSPQFLRLVDAPCKSHQAP